ncbi:MAG TPA: hypothetical protein VFE17_07760, partial [Candidatus Baltobacteraceae bacterium]|nr:hypothetical protein [Candidatus Baltobacteraceae bacterium]
QANIAQYPHDGNALLLGVEANWRGWLITHDDSWRALAFKRAAQPEFPIANVPYSWGPALLQAVKDAAAGNGQYSADEQTSAKAIVARVDKIASLKTIESLVAAPSHARQMTTLAPADEYFGPMGMSVLGIRNELNRVNYMIGYGYTTQESPMAVQIATSIDDMHKVYPRDRDLPQMLYDVYATLRKIDTPEAQTARAHVRAILTVEYQDSEQAQRLLSS